MVRDAVSQPEFLKVQVPLRRYTLEGVLQARALRCQEFHELLQVPIVRASATAAVILRQQIQFMVSQLCW